MFLAVTFAIALRQISSSTPLPVVVRYLNERLPAFSIERTSLKGIEARVNRVLGNGKVPKDWGSGLVQTEEDAIARVRHEGSAAVALVRGLEYKTALILLSQNGSRVSVSLLKDGGDVMVPWPEAAVRIDGNLVIAGATNWFGNGPSSSISVFGKARGEWHELQRVESESQDVGGPRMTFGADCLLRVTLNGRAYPDYLDACHAMAIISTRETWKYVSGKLSIVSRKRMPTPFAALDDLVKAVKEKDVRAVRRLCASSSIAARMQKLRPMLTGDYSTSVGVRGSVCSLDSEAFYLGDISNWFVFAKVAGQWKLAVMPKRNPKTDY